MHFYSFVTVAVGSESLCGSVKLFMHQQSYNRNLRTWHAEFINARHIPPHLDVEEASKTSEFCEMCCSTALKCQLCFFFNACRFSSSRSGRIYLHSDIRMIIFRKSDMDTATAHGMDMAYELRSFTHGPTRPKFSPYKWLSHCIFSITRIMIDSVSYSATSLVKLPFFPVTLWTGSVSPKVLS